jgi:hypothetical protein
MAHNIRDDCSSPQKNFLMMTLALLTDSRFLSLPSLSAQSITSALSLPPLLAAIGLAILMPRLPLLPLASLLAALLAAVTSHRVPWPEILPTALQQTDATPRTSSTSLGCKSPRFALILWMS